MKKRVKKCPIKPSELPSTFSARQIRRLLSPLKQENRATVEKYWSKWHKENPNKGLSDAAWGSLIASQRYW
jgi:hypothetical protein